MASVDLLIYGLLALAFLLLNLLPQWLKHRRQRDDAGKAQPIPRTTGGLDVQWGRGPRSVLPDARRDASRPPVERAARPPARQRPRLRDAKDLRDAIVLAAILGPCRAKEPYGSKEP